MRLAAVAPALGYPRDGQVVQARVGEVVAAPAQPLLAHPGGDAQPLAGEKPVQVQLGWKLLTEPSDVPSMRTATLPDCEITQWAL